MKTEKPLTTISAITTVLIRIYAFIQLTWMIPQVSLGIMTLATQSGLSIGERPAFAMAGTIMYYGSVAILSILALLALILAKQLARFVTPKHADARIAIDPNDLVALGSFLIGLLYLVQYVPKLAMAAGVIFYKLKYTAPDPSSGLHWLDYEKPVVYGSIVLTAFFLAFRPHHIAKFFGWLRSAGHARPAPPKEEQD